MPDPTASPAATSNPAGAAAAASAAADSIVDDAQSAADGTRQAAKWFASALAGIPALGIIGSLVKGPGTAGYDTTLLFVGLTLGGAGAYLGIYFFSKVLTPIPLEDNDMQPSGELTRLPGQPYETYEQLKGALSDSRYAFARDQHRAETAKVYSASDDAIASAAEAQATLLETKSSHDKTNVALKKRAEDARSDADVKRAEASSSAATAAAFEQQATIWSNQIRGIEKIRTQVFHLRASDLVGQRYRTAQQWAILAGALVIVGVFLIAIAPKQSPTTQTVSLLTLHLNQAGKDKLACPMDTISAIRIGGTEAVPRVFMLPAASCRAQMVDFPIEPPTPLGRIEQTSPLAVPSPSPSPSR